MKRMRKVLFVDIDGVLNSTQFRQEFWDTNGRIAERTNEELDPAAVRRLARICQEAGAQWVLSSTWRRFHPLSKVHGLLYRAGGLARTPAGRTPYLAPQENGRSALRGWEIMWWLRMYVSPEDLPNVGVAILDDDSDMGELMDRLCLCPHETGLTDVQVEQAIQMLNTPLGDTSHWPRDGYARVLWRPPPIGPTH